MSDAAKTQQKSAPADKVDAPPKVESPKTARVKTEGKKVVKRNVLDAPKVCPPGYRMDATGKCRKIL